MNAGDKVVKIYSAVDINYPFHAYEYECGGMGYMHIVKLQVVNENRRPIVSEKSHV